MTGASITACIEAVGYWSRGFANAEALARGVPDETATSPVVTLGSKRHLRYTSDVTRMAMSVAEQVIAQASLDLETLNVIFASSQGEIQIAVELLDKIADEGSASPARFMNSVHNTVCGHLSIAAKSHGMFSALAGAGQTVSAAFIEAYALIATDACENVIVVIADERLPAPVDLVDYDGLSAAFLLRGVAADSSGGARIERIVCDPSVSPSPTPTSLAANPCAPVVGVLARLKERKAGLVRLDGEGGEGWCMELSF